MKCFLTIIFLALIAITVSCEKEQEVAPLPPEAKIQINVPDEPYPGTRTKVITYDVQSDRNIFYEFYSSTKRVGRCSPHKLEQKYKAYEVMTIWFSPPSIERGAFYILKKPSGEWISDGFGGVEVYDDPEGFPRYRYSKRVLKKIKLWYERNVPAEARKR